MSDDNLFDLGISEQCQELGTLIIDPTATLFDHRIIRPALGIAPADQQLGLGVQVLLVFIVGHPSIDSYNVHRSRAMDR